MTKRKIISLCVPAVAFATVVGVGFSAWFFDAKVSKDMNIGVTITDSVGFGELTLANKDYTLVLDQGGSQNKSNVTVGAYLEEKEADKDAVKTQELTATWTVPTITYNDTKDDAGVAQINYTMNVYVKETTLGKYIKVTGDDFVKAAEAVEGFEVYSKTFTTTGENPEVTVSEDLANTTVEMTYTLATNWIQYYSITEATPESGKISKPTNKTDYDAMVELLENSTDDIRIEFVVENTSAA